MFILLVASITWLGFNWDMALVIGLSVFIHEFGHVWMFQRLGISITRVSFIPFFGASVSPGREILESKNKEFWGTLWGPVTGSLLGILTAVGYLVVPDNRLLMAAIIIVGLNILNMLPFMPLDGGMMITAILRSRKKGPLKIFYLVTVLAELILLVQTGNLLIIFLLVIGLIGLHSTFDSAILDLGFMTKNEILVNFFAYNFSLAVLTGFMLFLLGEIGGWAVFVELVKTG